MESPSNVPLKQCVDCGRNWPATTAHFHKSKDGFHSRCRTCRNKKAKNDRNRDANAKLEAMEKRAVRAFARAADTGGANIPHSSELLETIMGYFGGANGFASTLVKQYYDSPVGGAFRTKILDSILKLTTTNTALGGSKKPLDLMTEEELEADLRAQVLRAAGDYARVKVIDEVRALPVVEPDSSAVGGVQEVPSDLGEERGSEIPEDARDERLRGMG